MQSAPKDIRELTLEDLEKEVVSAGERPFRGAQIANWVYARRIVSFDEMTDAPSALRAYLKERFKIGSTETVHVSRSSDRTRKLLVRMSDGEEVESVIIPAEDRVTLCISTQAGCAMGCSFCATALMGLKRNLLAAEIVGQVLAAEEQLEEKEQLTNFVFMGMGEPLANYPRLLKALTIMTAPWGLGISPRRITVSTVGLAPTIEKLIDDTQVRLAISLHAASDELRHQLVPINSRYSIDALIETCKKLPLKRRDRITFEYVMLAGVNDSASEAKKLVRLLAPLRAKVNLICFNPFAGAAFKPSSRRAIEDFQAVLRKGNLTATIRESRGGDIAAACGQLRLQSGRAGRAAMAAV